MGGDFTRGDFEQRVSLMLAVWRDFLAWSWRTILWLTADATSGAGGPWARRLDQEATGRWHPISIRVVLRLPGDRAVPIRGGKVRPHDHPHSAPVKPPAPV